MRSRFVVPLAFVFAFALVIPRPALADPPKSSAIWGQNPPEREEVDSPEERTPPLTRHHHRFDLPFARDSGFLRLDTFASTGAVRTAAGGAHLLGFGVAFELRSDFLVATIVDFRYSGATSIDDVVGPSTRTQPSALRLGDSSFHELQVGLPTILPAAFQLVSTKSNWKARLDVVQWGLTHGWSTSQVTSTAGGVGRIATSDRWGVYATSSIAVCRGVGEWEKPLRAWFCAFASPTIYDANTGGWLSGGVLGLRAEL